MAVTPLFQRTLAATDSALEKQGAFNREMLAAALDPRGWAPKKKKEGSVKEDDESGTY